MEYFQGMIGQPEGGSRKNYRKSCLKGKKSISVRPGTLLEPVDFDAIEKMLKEKYYLPKMEDPMVMEQKSISYALYPKYIRITVNIWKNTMM